MQDLTRLAAGSMWVTSQEGGNLVHDNSPAMTAPGTDPATPLPPAENQANPKVDTGAERPVGTSPSRHVHGSFTPTSANWKAVSDG